MISRWLKTLFWDVAQESLIEGLERLIGISEHVPCGCLALEDTKVVIGIDQIAGESAEEGCLS